MDAATQDIAELLNSAETGFRAMMPHQYPTYASQAPFFYADSARSFFINQEDIWGYLYFPMDFGFRLPPESYITPGPEYTEQRSHAGGPGRSGKVL